MRFPLKKHEHIWEPTDTEGHILECVCGAHLCQEPEPVLMEAGSREAIAYTFFQFVDEIGHALNLDNFKWYVRFCKWAHRKEQ